MASDSFAARPFVTTTLALLLLAGAGLCSGTAAMPSPVPQEMQGNQGIGPGSQLLVERGVSVATVAEFVDGHVSARTGPDAFATAAAAKAAAPSHSLCTANWVWKDQAGNPYLGTAGHCVIPEVATNTSTLDYDASGVRVFACRSVCVFGGESGAAAGLASMATPSAVPDPAGDWVRLGEVRYARRVLDGVQQGNDFAVIAIPDGLVADLNASMAGWGAPAGHVTSAGPTDLAVLHGNGVYTGETWLSRDRQGRFTAFGAASFETSLESAGGDSGGPVGLVDADGVLWAAGIHTHGDNGCTLVVEPAVHMTYNDPVKHCGGTGTTVQRAIAMAREDGLCLELVLPTEDLSDLDPAADCFP